MVGENDPMYRLYSELFDLKEAAVRIADALEVLAKAAPTIMAGPLLAQAVVNYLEWGAMTGSDRDYHAGKFREALAAAGMKAAEPAD